MAEVNPQKLYKDLDDKKFSPLYFFYGDEPYLLNQIPDRFKYSVLDENSYDFNFSSFYARDVEVSVLKDAVETLPIMTQNRLVILKNAQDLSDSEWGELETLISNPVDTTVFVIIADKIDKRKKWVKQLLDKSLSVEFKKPFENQIPQWIHFLAQNEGLVFSQPAIHRIHRLVGNQLTELSHQISKIKDYVGDRKTVEVADINEVVSHSKEESVFDFTKAIGHKDRVMALEQLVSLFDQGENEMAIIALLARHMRILLTVRSGMDQGLGGAKLASLAQVPAYFIESYCDQARQWPVKKIEEALIILADTDKALKSSPLSSHIWLENLVLKSCSL